jgi:hypothetical protein
VCPNVQSARKSFIENHLREPAGRRSKRRTGGSRPRRFSPGTLAVPWCAEGAFRPEICADSVSITSTIFRRIRPSAAAEITMGTRERSHQIVLAHSRAANLARNRSLRAICSPQATVAALGIGTIFQPAPGLSISSRPPKFVDNDCFILFFSIYAAFLAFCFPALIRAQRSFANLESLARRAADTTLFARVFFLRWSEPLAVGVLAPPKATIAPRTPVNCRSSFASSCFRAASMSMMPPAKY